MLEFIGIFIGMYLLTFMFTKTFVEIAELLGTISIIYIKLMITISILLFIPVTIFLIIFVFPWTDYTFKGYMLGLFDFIFWPLYILFQYVLPVFLAVHTLWYKLFKD